MIAELRARLVGSKSLPAPSGSFLGRAQKNRENQTAQEENYQEQNYSNPRDPGGAALGFEPNRQDPDSGILFSPESWFLRSDLKGVAAVEAVASYWGRCLSAAVVDPDLPAIDPRFLLNLGRRMFMRGEAVYRIMFNETTGAMRFSPSPSWDISGNDDPESWIYNLDVHGPSRSVTAKRVPQSQVLHFMWAEEPEQPWVGKGPLSYMAGTAELAKKISRAMVWEFQQGHGSLLVWPGNVAPNPTFRTRLVRSISQMTGGTAMVAPSDAADMSMDGAIPHAKVERIGANPPQPVPLLMDGIGRAVAAAGGLPPALISQSAGNSQRESYRNFLHTTMSPLARLCETELSRKLNMDVKFDLGNLRATDLAGVARANKALVESGVPLQESLVKVGLDQ